MDKTSFTEVWVFVVALFVFSTITYAETTTSSTCPDGSNPVLTILGYICMDSTSSGSSSTSTTTPDTATTTTSTATTTTTTTNTTSTTTTGTATTTESISRQIIYVTPQNPTAYVGERIYFKAYVNGALQHGLYWVAGGGIFSSTFGDGVYSAPSYPGVFNITAYNPMTYNWGTTTVTVIARETTVSQTSYTATSSTPTTTYTPPVYTTTYTDTPTATSATTSTKDTFVSDYTYTTARDSASGSTNTSLEPEAEYSNQVYRAIETISAGGESKETPEEEIFLFNKDSNGDGISDYDSIYVYGIDPVKPFPTTTYEGRQISAGEKVLLGFDPKEEVLIKIAPEEPLASEAPIAEVYRVKNVSLTPDKKIAIKGRALPNSFVTIYIYSTPIVVTVKTNEEGEWQYLLDKELEDGTHEIYTATVNNTGKILAKSRQFTFVKTAEAATLNSPLSLDITAEKPSFLSQVNIYIIVLVFGVVLVLSLIFIGTKEEPKADAGVNQSNTGV